MPRVSRERRRSIIDRPTRSLFILLYSFLLEEKKTSTAIFLFQSIHFFLFGPLSFCFSFLQIFLEKEYIRTEIERKSATVELWNRSKQGERKRERKRRQECYRVVLEWHQVLTIYSSSSLRWYTFLFFYCIKEKFGLLIGLAYIALVIITSFSLPFLEILKAMPSIIACLKDKNNKTTRIKPGKKNNPIWNKIRIEEGSRQDRE